MDWTFPDSTPATRSHRWPSLWLCLWDRVTSGVPQGTVQGPLIILTFINDIPNGITSNFRLFADDCPCISRFPPSMTDPRLQQHLNLLHQWSTNWQMQLNTDKCYLIRFTSRQKIIDAYYHTGGSQLSSVDEYPYLGLSFSTDMSWQKHIGKITTKANRMLGLLRRNLKELSAEDSWADVHQSF